MHFNFGRGLRHTDDRMIVIVRLHDASVLDGDLLKHHLADAVDDGPLRLVDGAAGMHDV
ncbi:hypothetical protein D3C83_175140 [compost metagenome]